MSSDQVFQNNALQSPVEIACKFCFTYLDVYNSSCEKVQFVFIMLYILLFFHSLRKGLKHNHF